MEESLYNNLGAQVETPDLLSELAPPKTVIQTPMASIRNRAAAIAMMSEGNPVENYGVATERIKDGSIQSTKLWGDIENGVRTDTLQGTMSILASPDYSFEEKQRLINEAPAMKQVNVSQRLAEKALIEPSAGETEKEELVRINTLDILDNQARARSERQALVNAHASTLDSETSKAFSDFLASDFLPFGNNVIQARIARARGEGLFGTLKALILPGSDRAEMQEAYFEIPTDKEAELGRKYVEIVSKNAGVLFPDENHYAQFTKLQQLVSGEKPSRTGEILENLAPLLDIFGLRAEYKAGKLLLQARKAERELKAMKGLSKEISDPLRRVEPAAPSEATTGASRASGEPIRGGDESLLTKPSTPDQAVAGKRKEIMALEAEKARLLEDQNLAGRGDIRSLEAEKAALRAPDTDAKTLAANIKKANPRMSSKDARIEAQKRIDDELADYNSRAARIEEQIATNSGAAKTQQRIADLEKQITSLSKGVPENAGSVRTALADEISRIEWNSLARIDNPASVGNIIGSVNPGKARSLFTAVVADETGQVAEAIYGTSRVDAIAANVFPQAIPASGSVVSKVTGIDGDLFVNPAIKEKSSPTSLMFSRNEYAQADATIRDKFAKVSGLTVNDAMGGIILDRKGAITHVSSVYGGPQGGFLTAKEAKEQALFALRELGVKEDEVEILAKDGISHRPITMDEAGDAQGEFYVRLKMPYETKVSDIPNLDKETVWWNWADHIPVLMGNQYTGSLTRTLVDIASMFTKRGSSSSVRTSDIAAGLNKILIDQVKEFTDKFDSLKDVRKKKMHDYLKEANMAQLKDNRADLVARGFTSDEIDTIKSFRNFWDTAYYLENGDFVRTLDSEGWKVLQHPTEQFVAKEIPPNMWGEVKEFLDPRTGNVEVFDDVMRININNSKGQIAVLRRPTDINGKTVTHIFVDNNPTSYLRAPRNTDRLLNKLDGYYSIVYKSPRFVDRITMDGKGNTIRREAVAVAGDWQTAENFAKRQSTTGNERYVTRGDEKAMRVGSDDWFDIHAGAGRIAQRHRGKPLVDSQSAAPTVLGDESFVLSPVDSAVRASRSIAGRVASRPMLEQAKARWVRQYSEFLKRDKVTGDFSFPGSLQQIGKEGIPSERGMEDARSGWEYINYLENGYLNAADVVVRQLFNSSSIALGKAGATRLEKVAGAASEIAPFSAAKGIVFNTMVGTSILRNWIIQNAQLIRLPAYNWNIAGTLKNVSDFFMDHVNMVGNPKYVKSEFGKFVDDSFLLSTVDAQNMVRGSIHNAIDHSNKVLAKADKGIGMIRNISFDKPEQLNLLAHLASVYDKFKRAGKNLNDPIVREEAMAEARHLTGNMNFAGDFPYNQTAVSLVTQFLQAPHKMFLLYTNRALPWDVRARLFAWDAFFWGVPASLVYNSIVEEQVPEPEVRKEMVEGAFSYRVNKLLNEYLDTDKKIDFSSLNPRDMSGFAKIYEAMLTGGADEMMTNTPFGSMFGDQGRLANAMRVWSHYFKGLIHEDLSNVELVDAMNETAKIFPAVNNAYKAWIITKYQERRDSRGFITEEDVPEAYAYLQAFGFGSKGIADAYAMSKELTKQTKQQEDDLYKVYRHSLSVMSAVEDESMSDLESRTRRVNFLLAPYEDVPWAKKKLVEWLRRDMTGQDLNTHMRLMKLAGIPDDGDFRRTIERMPNLTEEEKNSYIMMLQQSKKEIDNEED